MRRNLIIWLTFLGGVFYFWEYIFPAESGLPRLVPTIGKVQLVVGAFALALGMINLLRLHVGRIVKRRPGFHNSIALVAGLVLMLTAQIYTFHVKDPTATRQVFDGIRRVLFDAVYQGLSSTVFSLLAFYIASAAYRAFRIRSFEAGLMMCVAVLVMLGQIPVGTSITRWLYNHVAFFPGWLRFEEIRTWVMEVWNSAAQRGILFGIQIGMIAMTLRIWLSLERGSFFEDV